MILPCATSTTHHTSHRTSTVISSLTRNLEPVGTCNPERARHGSDARVGGVYSHRASPPGHTAHSAPLLVRLSGTVFARARSALCGGYLPRRHSDSAMIATDRELVLLGHRGRGRQRRLGFPLLRPYCLGGLRCGTSDSGCCYRCRSSVRLPFYAHTDAVSMIETPGSLTLTMFFCCCMVVMKMYQI